MMRILNLFFTLVVIQSLVGCTYIIDLKPTEQLFATNSKSNLVVNVYDYNDRTKGDNGREADSGTITISNLSKIHADHTASILKNTGFFKEVRRINSSSVSIENDGSPDIIAIGEIKEFKVGGNGHAITFINPISILCVVSPIPSCYCYTVGNSDVSTQLIDAKSRQIIQEFPFVATYGPEDVWNSLWLGKSSNPRISGAGLVRQFSEDLNKKITQNLKADLGRVILAKDNTAAEFLPEIARTSLPISGEAALAIQVIKSDVDDLPAVKPKNRKNAYAIVIGIENYRQKLPSATYATHDARIMTEYLTKVLGYPEENVITITNDKAAKSDFEKYFERWLPNNVEAGGSVFVYYSGHGAPNPKSGDAYLVPYDGDPTFLDQTGYSLKRMYEALGKLKAKEVVVALDSCFSGAGGKSVLAEGARPLVMNLEKAAVVSQNMIIFSAAAGDQISSTYKEKGHGLFTYFLLKGIKGTLEEDKFATLEMGELYNYLKPQVERVARKIYNTEQVPQIITPNKSLEKSRLF